MNRLQLREMVIANLGSRSDKNTIINSVLDMALARVLSTERWTFTNVDVSIDVEDGDSYVTLPNDCGKIMSLTLVDGTSILGVIEKNLDWFKRYLTTISTTTKSTPTICAQEGSILQIYPPADKAYSLNVSYMLSTTLTSDSSTTPSPILDEPIIAYATAYVFKSLQMFQESSLWEQAYAQSLTHAIQINRMQGFIKSSSFTERQPEVADDIEGNVIYPVQPFDPNSMR
jgi:hypothetical protein